MADTPVLFGVTLTFRMLGAIMFWAGLILGEEVMMLLGVFLYGTQVGWW